MSGTWGQDHYRAADPACPDHRPADPWHGHQPARLCGLRPRLGRVGRRGQVLLSDLFTIRRMPADN
jgi:hypothetical protein